MADRAEKRKSSVVNGHSHTYNPRRMVSDVANNHTHPLLKDGTGIVISLGVVNGHSHGVTGPKVVKAGS